MSEISFESEQVHAVLIASGGISVAEGMSRECTVHAKGTAQREETSLEPLLVHRPVKAPLLCKEPFHGTFAWWEGIPILEDEVPNAVSERDEAVRMVLGLGNVYLHGGMADVGTLKMAQFIQAHAGSIKDGNGKLKLKGVCSLKEPCYFLRGRDVRKKGVKGAERELSLIPILMQDIHVEKLKIGDHHVDGAVGKGALLLKEIKEGTHILPGSVLRRNGKVIKILEIRLDISRVRTDGIVRKSFCMKHLNKG